LDIQLISLVFLAYLIGSIPFGLILSRLKGVDIRSQGSGNIGATNVFRVMGWQWGIMVFILDGLKGYGPTLLAHAVTEQSAYIILVGAMTIIGHSLSLFVKFKGGKGAATGLGVLAAIAPDVFGIVFLTAAVLIYTTRYVAPVSLLCSVLTPVLLYFFGYQMIYVGVVSAIAVVIFIRHKDNIKRLIRGEENRF
jgi:glycerol-3-phosphate acyltransferase PlsY